MATMKPLYPIPQCIDCLMSLAREAVVLAAAESSELVAKAESAARQILMDAKDSGLSSHQVANRILREIRSLTGVSDPYAQFKAREMARAQKIYADIKDDVGDDLRSRVRLAILGNSLDFFKNPEQALVEVPDQFRDGISFFRDDIDRLDTFLGQNPEQVLYLTDNAGEIYFDRPLYEYIKTRSRRTILVVKGGPSLNDLTRMELQSSGLADRFEDLADTGTDGAGIDWDHVSNEFLNLIASADLILSKGMANFEALYSRELPTAIFFLFKVKCEPIQNYIDAPANSFMALWKGVSK